MVSIGTVKEVLPGGICKVSHKEGEEVYIRNVFVGQLLKWKEKIYEQMFKKKKKKKKKKEMNCYTATGPFHIFNSSTTLLILLRIFEWISTHPDTIKNKRWVSSI